MNIIRKKTKSHLFDEASVGEIFEYDGSIFMKFGKNAYDCLTNKAICLEDGIITCFMGNEEIQSVNADLVIH